MTVTELASVLRREGRTNITALELRTLVNGHGWNTRKSGPGWMTLEDAEGNGVFTAHWRTPTTA